MVVLVQRRRFKRRHGKLRLLRLLRFRMNIVDNRPTTQPFKAYIGAEGLDDEEKDEEPGSSRTDGGLSARLGDKEFDPVTFVVTKVEPSAFASQLTLLDLPVFQAIRPEELSSCAWNTKEKLRETPNVVAFTRRFNHVCLWAQKEILSPASPKARAEAIAHFIRIAKKLLELCNLHSAFAIVSALDSSPVFRLSASWAGVPASQKASMDKMRRLFSDDRNWDRLRKHLSGLKLPAIPYLGLYLTDLLYIDLAHPHSGNLATGPRATQMNNILRVLADFQRSEYPPALCPPLPCVRQYLDSHAYIDELQKFVEDDLYKLSLEKEPREADSKPSRRESHPVGAGGTLGRHPASAALLSPSPARLGGRMQLVAKTASFATGVGGGVVFKPSHRKTASLGSHAAAALSLPPPAKESNETFPSLTRHLLDDSLLDVDGSCTGSSVTSSHFVADADDSGAETADCPGMTPGSSLPSMLPGPGPLMSSTGVEGLDGFSLDGDGFALQGPVRRKTLLKDGKRPSMTSGWTKYWLGLWGTNLFYFAARPIPNRHPDSRVAFKRKPAKMLSIAGWMVVMGEDPFNPDSFQLQEPSRGNVYKFRAGSQAKAMDWVRELQAASEKFKERLPANLMSFD